METKLKQRLIGAIVLIAIAVILIPMILDGDGRRAIELDVEMPPEPEFIFESDLPATTKLDELPVAEEPDTKPVPSEEKTPMKKEPDEANQAPASRIVEAAADHVKPDPALSAWVVQVGAFGEKSKALALQERLRAGDYPAFTEQVKDGDRVIYRVKVGPDLSRENAEELRTKLAKEYSLLLDGIFVKSHP